MILNSPTISGSLTVTGNIIASGSITLSGSIASASYAATASFVALAQSASFVLTAQTASFVANAQTASFVALAQSASNAVSAQTASFVANAQTASFVALAQSASNAVAAQTASFANTFTVAGNITAQTLVVQTITSSVDFVTGSTRFGTILDNTHVFSGSVTMNPGGLFVSSSGNIGIGTIAPSSKLSVSGDMTITAGTSSIFSFGVNSNSTFAFGSTNGRRVAIISHESIGDSGLQFGYDTIDKTGIIAGSANVTGSGIDFYTYNGSTWSNKMRVTKDGNVGIGITNPTRMLQVKSNSEGQTAGISGATYGIRFDNGGTNSPNMSTIHGTDSTLAGSYQPIMLNGLDVRFGTSDTERMRITSEGLIGIGVTPSAWGTVFTKSAIQFGGSVGVGALWTNSFNNGVFLGNNLYDDGAGNARYIVNGASSQYIQAGGEHYWASAASGTAGNVATFTERMRITIGGEVGIGVTPSTGNRFWVRGSSTSGSDTAMFVQNSAPSTLFSIRNDGIITKPLQPAFRAGRSSSYAPGANTPIVFNSTGGFGFNVGGHYNTSNGRFTAPINGIYNFTACVIWESVGNSQSMDDAFEIRVNGSTAAYSFRRATYIANTTGIGGYYVDNATVLLNLTAGQYVEINNRYNLTVHGNANYCYFNGYLVG
jgi:hypothetical protein